MRVISELLKQEITSRLPYLKPGNKGWLVCNCPLCVAMGTTADKRKRFGVMFESDGTIGVHCFNCTFVTKWTPGALIGEKIEFLLRHIGTSDDDIRKLKFQAFREKEAGDIFKTPELELSIKTNWTTTSLPKNSKPILEWLEIFPNDPNLLKCAMYALSRGFPDMSNIYWSPSQKFLWNKRIILPFTYNGKVVGYCGRYFEEQPNELEIRRYENRFPEHFVYGLDSQRSYNRKYVILTEGVIDAIMVDGVSTMGSVSKHQANIINSLGKEIIVLPDFDSNGSHLVDSALEYNWYVSFPNWDNNIKDASEASQKYGRLLTVQSIIYGIERNSTAIRIKRKIKGI